MAHAWNACWVNALGGSNPPSSANVMSWDIVLNDVPGHFCLTCGLVGAGFLFLVVLVGVDFELFEYFSGFCVDDGDVGVVDEHSYFVAAVGHSHSEVS